MHVKYHEKAAEKGVYIIGSSGFDSIPADLGVLYTRNQMNGKDWSIRDPNLTAEELRVCHHHDEASTFATLSCIPRHAICCYASSCLLLLFVVFVVLGIEFRASHMHKSSITEPRSQPTFKPPQGVLRIFPEHLQ